MEKFWIKAAIYKLLPNNMGFRKQYELGMIEDRLIYQFKIDILIRK